MLSLFDTVDGSATGIAMSKISAVSKKPFAFILMCSGGSFKVSLNPATKLVISVVMLRRSFLGDIMHEQISMIALKNS